MTRPVRKKETFSKLRDPMRSSSKSTIKLSRLIPTILVKLRVSTLIF